MYKKRKKNPEHSFQPCKIMWENCPFSFKPIFRIRSILF